MYIFPLNACKYESNIVFDLYLPALEKFFRPNSATHQSGHPELRDIERRDVPEILFCFLLGTRKVRLWLHLEDQHIPQARPASEDECEHVDIW